MLFQREDLLIREPAGLRGFTAIAYARAQSANPHLP